VNVSILNGPELIAQPSLVTVTQHVNKKTKVINHRDQRVVSLKAQKAAHTVSITLIAMLMVLVYVMMTGHRTTQELRSSDMPIVLSIWENAGPTVKVVMDPNLMTVRPVNITQHWPTVFALAALTGSVKTVVNTTVSATPTVTDVLDQTQMTVLIV
jgi:hypothetical protein